MGLSALQLRPKHYCLLLLFHFSLVLMAVSLKPWREGLYLFIGPRLCYLSPIQLLEISDKIHLILQSKPQALHGHPSSIHRHDKACPCDNSLLTLLFQIVSVTLTDQILFWEWLHHKDIREGLQGFVFLKLATQIVRKALPKTPLTGKWCGSDRVQKRNLKWMNESVRIQSEFFIFTSPKQINKKMIKTKIKPYFHSFFRNYSSRGDTYWEHQTLTSASYGFLGVKHHLLSLP